MKYALAKSSGIPTKVVTQSVLSNNYIATDLLISSELESGGHSAGVAWGAHHSPCCRLVVGVGKCHQRDLECELVPPNSKRIADGWKCLFLMFWDTKKNLVVDN